MSLDKAANEGMEGSKFLFFFFHSNFIQGLYAHGGIQSLLYNNVQRQTEIEDLKSSHLYEIFPPPPQLISTSLGFFPYSQKFLFYQLGKDVILSESVSVRSHNLGDLMRHLTQSINQTNRGLEKPSFFKKILLFGTLKPSPSRHFPRIIAH